MNSSAKNEDSYGCVNIYAPVDQDDPKFFQNLFQEMSKLECDFWLMGGDFNLTLDPMMDQLSHTQYKPKA